MTAMLQIQDQPRLPLHKQVEICADGIHHRLFRATLTLSIVILAIAFLMNVLTESMIAKACKHEVFAEAQSLRQLNQFDVFFEGPLDANQLSRRIASSSPDSWQGMALSHWLGLTEPAYETLHDRTVQAEKQLGWLSSLSMGHRRMLIGNRDDRQSLAFLADSTNQQAFRDALVQIPSLSEPEGLLDFAAIYPDYEQRIEQLLAPMNSRLQLLSGQLDGEPMSERFATAADSSEELAKLKTLLADNHVELDDSLFTALQEQATHASRTRELFKLLSQPQLSSQWQSEYHEIYEIDTALATLASDPGRVRWLVDSTQAQNADVSQLSETLKRLVREREITATEERLAINYGRATGIGQKVFWLIVVSLLVCIVGIANAMLVSVLERFREIATMKCLGALDGFIAVLFLLEAAFLGAVGGLIGVLIGFVIGLLRMTVGYGGWVYSSFPVGDLLIAAGISVLTGLALATLAAIYPAWMASRMPPMEAMRIE